MSKEKLLYPFYILTHPMDGFYEVRHREKGSVPLSLLILLLFSISFSINKRYAGFVVNDINPLSVNSFQDFKGIFALFFLFCVANWSITCLVEGEGRLKDIVTVVGYATLPLVLAYIPATLFSQIIAENEEAFYYLVLGIAIAWFLLLIFIGIMTVHNFTFGKMIGTLICTFIAMLIIIFIILLIMTLIQQVYTFFESIYTELLFRV
ncbi:Yip1 family protein [Anaeromicropila herbilytica]|uniref:Yip1 domain-containing protein n=1 Tax=Anaeromicropila herbilytica TaxID=2785025 RepID=A0A7R7IBH9_9FIRM|nr:Yip1 family protein [Anaeromicropila herbilytica]BCN29632.1 hypothetical protein bsdtb5_09270 [Anaeromicropila herbilytica]